MKEFHSSCLLFHFRQRRVATSGPQRCGKSCLLRCRRSLPIRIAPSESKCGDGRHLEDRAVAFISQSEESIAGSHEKQLRKALQGTVWPQTQHGRQRGQEDGQDGAQKLAELSKVSHFKSKNQLILLNFRFSAEV